MLQLGIFIAVTAGSLALFFVVGSQWQPGRARIRRRLAGEFVSGQQNAPSRLYKDLDVLDEDFGTPEAAGADTSEALTSRRLSPQGRVENLLRQAGINRTARQIAWFTLGISVALGGLGLGLFGWLAGLGGCVVGVVAVLFVITTQRRSRRERYLLQLLGAFELMARVLRAGQAVPEAFRAAVEAFEEPLKSEFEQCLHQIEHGLRPETAFRELSERSGILELRIFVVAMTIQRQSGGNLSEVLDRLASVVRNRKQVRQKIRSLTAEGRLQALTLVILPGLTFGFMYILNQPYAELLLQQGRLLAATVILMGIGVLWIRNIMNFEG